MDKIEIDIIREEALRRFALIAPLLEDGISAFEKTRRKLLLLENNETSERTLRRWCKAHEVTPEAVPDKRYPKGVKAWPAAAWMDVYGVDIAALFAQEAA